MILTKLLILIPKQEFVFNKKHSYGAIFGKLLKRFAQFCKFDQKKIGQLVHLISVHCSDLHFPKKKNLKIYENCADFYESLFRGWEKEAIYTMLRKIYKPPYR